MKENLKEYINSFDCILETKFLSEIECTNILEKLISRKENWENRIPKSDYFMSYGALTYLDADKDNLNYKEKSIYFNKLLMEDFSWVYDKIKKYYQEKFIKPVVFKKALPGFHIFQNPKAIDLEVAKNSAAIHIDLPQIFHNWGSNWIASSSFTIAIELPKCTAGLNIWKDNSVFDNIKTTFYDQMSKEDQIKVTNNAEYYPYKLGHMYEQSGMIRHQITVKGEVLENERRITMQGHLVEVDDEIIIYV